MKAKFTNKYNEVSNIWTFNFKPEYRLDYIAGQFIELTINLPNNQGKENRWFTLTSTPTQKEYLSITTRITKNPSNYKKSLNKLQEGDTVNISEAMGDFVLPKNTNINLLFIALGIGITPYISIIKYLTDKNESRNINLFYIGSQNKEIPLIDTIKKYNANFHLNVEKISLQNIRYKLNNMSDKNERQFYISGPEDVVVSIRNILLEMGIDDHSILGDYFPGYHFIE